MSDSALNNACLFPCHSKGIAKNVFNRGTFTLVNSTELTGSPINEQVCCRINGRNGCWWGNGTCWGRSSCIYLLTMMNVSVQTQNKWLAFLYFFIYPLNWGQFWPIWPKAAICVGKVKKKKKAELKKTNGCGEIVAPWKCPNSPDELSPPTRWHTHLRKELLKKRLFRLQSTRTIYHIKYTLD